MDITNVMSTLAVFGMKKLRERLVWAKIANRDYESKLTGGVQKFTTINIVVPPAITAVDVTPAATPAATTSVTPTVVPVTLSSHKYCPFFLTDKDLERLGAGAGQIPMGLDSAITSLATAIETDLATAYKYSYGWAGTEGITPFSTDLSEFLAAKLVSHTQRMPPENRFMVLNTTSEANALNLPNFQNASFSADPSVMMNGIIGRKLGALWVTSDDMPSHTTAAAGTVLTDSVSTFLALTTVHFDGLTTKPELGDVFTVAGDTQTYTVISSTTLVGTDSDVTISPAAKVNWGNDAAVTFKASHAVNCLVQREAIAFAMAPMSESNLMPGAHPMQAVIDPESGLGFRITLEREFFRWRWAVDALWGWAVPRPEALVRLVG